jgi:hypothetical protein
MKVEFYRLAPGAPAEEADAEVPPPALVATATWVDGKALLECDDDDLRGLLQRVYRMTPVITDEPAYRRRGSPEEVTVMPGTLEWFRAASFVRAPAEAGVEARLVPGAIEGGYDPAAQYRGFRESIERLSSGSESDVS